MKLKIETLYGRRKKLITFLKTKIINLRLMHIIELLSNIPLTIVLIMNSTSVT
jgi:hypothetical protein